MRQHERAVKGSHEMEALVWPARAPGSIGAADEGRPPGRPVDVRGRVGLGLPAHTRLVEAGAPHAASVGVHPKSGRVCDLGGVECAKTPDCTVAGMGRTRRGILILEHVGAAHAVEVGLVEVLEARLQHHVPVLARGHIVHDRCGRIRLQQQVDPTVSPDRLGVLPWCGHVAVGDDAVAVDIARLVGPHAAVLLRLGNEAARGPPAGLKWRGRLADFRLVGVPLRAVDRRARGVVEVLCEVDAEQLDLERRRRFVASPRGIASVGGAHPDPNLPDLLRVELLVARVPERGDEQRDTAIDKNLEEHADYDAPPRPLGGVQARYSHDHERRLSQFLNLIIALVACTPRL
eukprot:6486289-Prymnesium_polylepis.1